VFIIRNVLTAKKLKVGRVEPAREATIRAEEEVAVVVGVNTFAVPRLLVFFFP